MNEGSQLKQNNYGRQKERRTELGLRVSRMPYCEITFLKSNILS